MKKIHRLPDNRGPETDRAVMRGLRKFSTWKCRCLKLLEPQHLRGRITRYGWVVLKPPTLGTGLALIGEVVDWDGVARVVLSSAYTRVYVVGGDENGTDMTDLLCYALEHWKRCVKPEVVHGLKNTKEVKQRVWSYPGWHKTREVLEVLV